MLTIVEILFWSCLGCIALSYFGYPLLLAVWSFRRRHVVGDELPRVSLVISAYNEAAVIGAKIENALAIDYPAEKLEIVVISDESDDGTDEMVERYAGQGVVLFRQSPRQGKSAGLTRFVPETRGEVIVFSDANSMYEPDAIRKLVRHFADERVGYVVGQQRYRNDSSEVSAAESAYWKYETWIKQQESRVGSVVGGDGAISAIRWELFQPLRHDDISDFTLPLQIVAQGYRGVYEPEAVCHEETATSFQGEFRRKARIVNRSLRAVLRVPSVLNPFRVGLFALQLFIHKVLRWFVPFFLCVMLACSVYLAVTMEGIYEWALWLQGAFYATALLRVVPVIGRFRPVFLPYYFCVVNAAAGVGILQVLAGRQIATWTPDRDPQSAVLGEQSLSGNTKSA